MTENENLETFEQYKGAGVYADLMLDRTFKKAFSPDGAESKKCLIAFLNAILGKKLKSPIKDVSSRDKEIVNESNQGKTTVFDLYCVDQLNRHFVIEVQIANLHNIVNRAIYYAAQVVTSLSKKGKAFTYEIHPIFTIVLMEFSFFPDEKIMRFAQLREPDGTPVSDTLQFVFVELPKFKKKLNQLESTLDKGFYALKNIKKLKEMPKAYLGSEFEYLFKTSKLSNLSPKDLLMIDEAMMAKWDELAARKAAKEDGFAEGHAEGHAEGLAEGFRTLAKGFRDEGIPLNIIAKQTGLSIEEIKAL